jgi:hypothetical protein
VAIGVAVTVAIALGAARQSSTHAEASPTTLRYAPPANMETAAPPTTSAAVSNDSLEDAIQIPPMSPGALDVAARDNPDATPAQTAAVYSAFSRVQAAGVPASVGATIVVSVCTGGTGGAHWGYYNNGATGGTVPESDGAVVPLGAVCINPSQPDVYSTLAHELGHKYFWEHGLWDYTTEHYGGSETAAECFAKIYGATVFGQGGCADDMARRMRVELHL